MPDSLLLSVIICTYNRASLLKQVLESLLTQTLKPDEYEIIIIDDGSSDNTREIVKSFSKKLPIKYFYQNNAGLASAKNHGIYASRGSMLFFMDDDDKATPTLLEEHVLSHRKYPKHNYAVLNFTGWAPDNFVTPLMNFVTEVGCFLFSYCYIKHGDILDYTYFWGGRTSCKRSFLIEHGVHNPIFRFGCEDIELGHRLSKFGLKVVYNAKATSLMIRPVTFEDFCRRLIKQGRSQYVFSTLHNDNNVHKWAEVVGADEKWNEIEPLFNSKMRSAQQLDKISNLKREYGFDMEEQTENLLHEAYWWVFKACKIKGIIETKRIGRLKKNLEIQ